MHKPAAKASTNDPWGSPPWKIDFAPPAAPFPTEVDFAVIGAGFTGLAAAAWLRRIDPGESVAVLEATRIGAGASGRTGGMVLGETAAGNAEGLGDVLEGLQDILDKLNVECELSLPGAWEVSHTGGRKQKSAIHWEDSGSLRVSDEVPGGTLNPGKLVSGLARAAERLGARIFENSPVRGIEWRDSIVLNTDRGSLRAEKVLFATNALSLVLAGFDDEVSPRLTLAVASEPLSEERLAAIGLAERKPFYTVDLPYLWGRVCADNSVIWGAGLVPDPGSRDLHDVTIAGAESARLLDSLERRVRGLHPALKDVEFTNRWGGPILFRESWLPGFDTHPKSERAIVLGAYAGHGVALSSYLGAWAAEALLGKRELPAWGRINR